MFRNENNYEQVLITHVTGAFQNMNVFVNFIIISEYSASKTYR